MYTDVLAQTTNFLPAVTKLIPSIGLCIEYYVVDPNSEKFIRKRVRLGRLTSRISRQREKYLAAQKICDEINSKLRNGWTPLYETSDGRLYTTLADLRTKFLASKKAEGCRDTTLVQYGSVTEIFVRWCEDNGYGRKYSSTFLRNDAIHYCDYIMSLQNRHRSYNNTVKVLRALFQWAIDHCYAKENPFGTIKLLKKEEKIRSLVDPDSRQKIFNYYSSVKPEMNIVCELVYSSAIRPIEITRIQCCHVHLDQHYIVIPSDNAKNHHERIASLTPSLVSMLQQHLSKDHSPEDYLFAQTQLAPGKKALNKSYFQKSWERMRNNTGLPKEMQLYSLRDTGLTDLLKSGLDPLTVKKHADHSSLAITDIYTSHIDPELTAKIFSYAPKFVQDEK